MVTVMRRPGKSYAKTRGGKIRSLQRVKSAMRSGDGEQCCGTRSDRNKAIFPVDKNVNGNRLHPALVNVQTQKGNQKRQENRQFGDQSS